MALAMASASDADCCICTNNFDSGQRQAVELPCGHEFCLSCLGSLRLRGKHECPRCRKSWADMDVRALPVMGALAAALDRDFEEEDDMGKKKKVDGFCKKHSLPFDFWAKQAKEFYCKKCAAKQINDTLILIEDAIPDIKATIDKEAGDADKKAKENLVLLENFNTKIEDAWSNVRKFKEQIDTLDNHFKSCSEEIKSTRSTLTKSLKLIEQVKGKVARIANEADVDVAVESRATLQQCTGPSSLPSSDLPKNLLCNIASSYTTKMKPDSAPTMEAFVGQLRQNTPDQQRTAAGPLASPSPSFGSSCSEYGSYDYGLVQHRERRGACHRAVPASLVPQQHVASHQQQQQLNAANHLAYMDAGAIMDQEYSAAAASGYHRVQQQRHAYRTEDMDSNKQAYTAFQPGVLPPARGHHQRDGQKKHRI